MAVIHVLRWARAPANVAVPMVLRYDSKYAALITVGVYKAKKNKALVATAQKEWKLTYAAKQGNMWMRHVKRPLEPRMERGSRRARQERVQWEVSLRRYTC